MAGINTEAPARCHNPSCKKASFSNDLLLCSACEKVRYCSPFCQKQDWKDHKLFCKHASSSGKSSAPLDFREYYEKIAVHDPQVQAIAHDMGLAISASGPDECLMAMRLLVAAGKDTPEHLSLFFGRISEKLADFHQTVRYELFLRPSPGSHMGLRARTSKLEQGQGFHQM
ncbi:hypothetical protein F5Y05DRAFT_377447, partial [Hypoxylon sp. FL0543]